MSRNSPYRFLFAIISLTGLSACQTMENDVNANVDADVAAVIVNPTFDSLASLQHEINVATQTVVLLADNALTQTSVLTIERNMPRSFDSAPAQGRETDPPIQFQLVKNGNQCILVDRRDGTRHKLENTNCVAEKK
jgi:hypothetical protein